MFRSLEDHLHEEKVHQLCMNINRNWVRLKLYMMYLDILKSKVEAEIWRSIPLDEDVIHYSMGLQLFGIVPLNFQWQLLILPQSFLLNQDHSLLTKRQLLPAISEQVSSDIRYSRANLVTIKTVSPYKKETEKRRQV